MAEDQRRKGESKLDYSRRMENLKREKGKHQMRSMLWKQRREKDGKLVTVLKKIEIELKPNEGEKDENLQKDGKENEDQWLEELILTDHERALLTELEMQYNSPNESQRNEQLPPPTPNIQPSGRNPTQTPTDHSGFQPAGRDMVTPTSNQAHPPERNKMTPQTTSRTWETTKPPDQPKGRASRLIQPSGRSIEVDFNPKQAHPDATHANIPHNITKRSPNPQVQTTELAVQPSGSHAKLNQPSGRKTFEQNIKKWQELTRTSENRLELRQVTDSGMKKSTRKIRKPKPPDPETIPVKPKPEAVNQTSNPKPFSSKLNLNNQTKTNEPKPEETLNHPNQTPEETKSKPEPEPRNQNKPETTYSTPKHQAFSSRTKLTTTTKTMADPRRPLVNQNQSPRNQKLKRLSQKPRTPSKSKPDLKTCKPTISESKFSLILQGWKTIANDKSNSANLRMTQIECQQTSNQSGGGLQKVEKKLKPA